MNKLAAFGMFMLMAGHLAAQTAPATEPPPQPPLLAPIPARTQWVMRVTPPKSLTPVPADDQAKPGGLPVYIAVTKVGLTMRSLVGMADKSRREYWQVGGTAVLQNDGHIRVMSNTQDYPLYTFAATGAFYGFNWIKPENFKSTEKHHGMDCHHYAIDLPASQAPTAGAGLSAPTHCEAWINADTRLPVSVTADFGLIDYEFSEPPASLSLPADLQAALDADNAALEKVRKRTHPH